MTSRGVSQRERSVNNPLSLGKFDRLTLRYLKGSLGPRSKVVGRSDTWDQSNGGYGQYTYNHWFQVTLSDSAWIIVTKGPPRPKYINVSVYDSNKTELRGLPVFQGDSISSTNSEGEVYYPYLDTAASKQSDLYNTFDRYRLDRGDDRYYRLLPGNYLICVSTTRNEPLDYEVGVVIEPRDTEVFILCEDATEVTYLIQENEIDADLSIDIDSPVTTPITLSSGVNAYTPEICSIEQPSGSVEIPFGSTWLITAQDTRIFENSRFLCDYGEGYLDTFHEHSLSTWQEAWERDHQQKDRFPAVFIPLCNER